MEQNLLLAENKFWVEGFFMWGENIKGITL